MTEPAEQPPAPAAGVGPPPRASTRPGTFGGGPHYRLRSGSAIVPRESASGHALTVVIAIMAFLACLSIGVVSVVTDTARRWQDDIAREATIQITPVDGVDMENAVRQASRLVLGFEGVARVATLDDASAARLLEPWLGSDIDLSELPIPTLLIVTVRPGATPDFDAMAKALSQAVPGAVLDDHRAWTGRLTRMAWTMVICGLVVLGLVLGATVLTVIFATRGAMSGSGDIIDVLHFVGAEPGFIARQFERHFLILGLRGAIAGGLTAFIVFAGLGLWTAWSRATPEGDQVAALFGTFTLSWIGYGAILIVAGAVAFLTAATSRMTVLNHVRELEVYTRRR